MGIIIVPLAVMGFITVFCDSYWKGGGGLGDYADIADFAHISVNYYSYGVLSLFFLIVGGLEHGTNARQLVAKV